MINFTPHISQMMIFLNPLNALIPKIPFSFFFAEFWVRATPGPAGSVSVGFWGARQLSPWGPSRKRKPAPSPKRIGPAVGAVQSASFSGTWESHGAVFRVGDMLSCAAH